jgi:hypothetical protein
MRLLIALAFTAFGLTSACADQTGEMKILQLIQSICDDIPGKTLTKTAIQEKIEANASALARIVSGDANVSASRTREIYATIPFDDLPNNIPSERCKGEVLNLFGQVPGTTWTPASGRPPPVLPTRAFLPPHDVPPENFAAYGIVAFQEKAMSSTATRHRTVCEAFIASLPPVSLAPVPAQQQMVTVWPVDSTTIPEQLQRANPGDVAVQHYDLPTALTALKEARTQQHTEFSGQGPHLLGWAPSSTKGQKDALVLVVDLSNARTSAELLERFKFWREQIEQKPELW